MNTFHEDFRFGSAEWCTVDEIHRAKLMGREGPFIGFMHDNPLRLAGDAPLITIGGSGSGKLRDVIAFNLCGVPDRKGNWRGPPRILMNDPRGDGAAISIHNQVRLGKAAYCINPFSLHGLPQHRVNPWNVISKESPTFHADVKLLIGDLIPLSRGDEKYFSARAREWAEALVKTYVWNAPVSKTRDVVSMPDFCELVNAIEDPATWEAVAEQMLNAPDGDVRRVAAEMDNKRGAAPKEYGAIMGSIFEATSFLSIPEIRSALSGSDFSLEVLCQQDCTVYMMIPAEFLTLLAPMQRAIFGAAMLYKNRNPSAPQVLFLIDEAAQLGNFDALSRAYSYGRGMGIRAWSFWQDPGQITRNFGPSSLSSFVGSSQCRQFFGIRDYETARLVSNMLGQQTLEYDAPLDQDAARTSWVLSLRDLMAGSDPVEAGIKIGQFERAARHRTKQARALMTPDELMTMPEHKQVLFISGLGLKPILASKHPYYTRREMSGAYLPNPYHGRQDRVKLPGRWWATRVIRERVPELLAHWPQYQSGEWSYVDGFCPVPKEIL